MARSKKNQALTQHLEDKSALLASLPLEGERIREDLLDLALTHRSYAYENGGVPHNERLEFLGDSILGFSVADWLYREFPEASQGSLSRRRAAYVNTRALSYIARHHNLGAYLKLGRGEALTGGRDRDSVLEDAMEALIGAVLLSAGHEKARGFVLRLLAPVTTNSEFLTAEFDYKSRLQEIGALMDLVPAYSHEEIPGPVVSYRATVAVGGVLTGMGEGPSKKSAEMQAARRAVDAYYLSRGETINLFED